MPIEKVSFEDSLGRFVLPDKCIGCATCVILSYPNRNPLSNSLQQSRTSSLLFLKKSWFDDVLVARGVTKFKTKMGYAHPS